MRAWSSNDRNTRDVFECEYSSSVIVVQCTSQSTYAIVNYWVTRTVEQLQLDGGANSLCLNMDFLWLTGIINASHCP